MVRVAKARAAAKEAEREEARRIIFEKASEKSKRVEKAEAKRIAAVKA